ncbi:LysR family transcriptional regulator [Mesorhizobium sp.]|nr:LysR family transcriptional regulator [Mesorhizobium sp.]
MAGGNMVRQNLLWRRLDWNLMRVFYEIVQNGGVTAAARAMNRQQPATSQALARLEDQLGVALCERGPGGFAVTEEGEIIFRIASEMVELMRHAPDLLTQAAGTVRGMLRISMMSSTRSRDFDEILTAIMRRHRHLEITVDLAPWRSALDAVQNGDADLAVTYVQILDPSLTYQPVFHEVQQLYCSPLHPLYGGRFDDPGALANEYFFLTGRDEPVEMTNFRLQFGLGTLTRGGSEDLGELKRLILTGTGIGFLPSLTVMEEVNQRTLWPLLSYGPLPSYPVHLVARPQAMRSLPAQLFFDEARRRLRARRQD